jgi:hypothetical protein
MFEHLDDPSGATPPAIGGVVARGRRIRFRRQVALGSVTGALLVVSLFASIAVASSGHGRNRVAIQPTTTTSASSPKTTVGATTTTTEPETTTTSTVAESTTTTSTVPESTTTTTTIPIVRVFTTADGYAPGNDSPITVGTRIEIDLVPRSSQYAASGYGPVTIDKNIGRGNTVLRQVSSSVDPTPFGHSTVIFDVVAPGLASLSAGEPIRGCTPYGSPSCTTHIWSLTLNAT